MRPSHHAKRLNAESRHKFPHNFSTHPGFFLYHHSIKLLLFLVGATLLFFWPMWLLNYRFPIGGGDLWGQLHPVWSYISYWLRRGSLPLWHTGMMAGDPIFSEGQYGLFNPLNWWMFLFSPVPGWVVSLRVMFTLWLAGAGMVLYLHHSPVWKLPMSSALVGALAYMFADPFIAHLGHPQFNDAMAWLPWTLWGVDGAVRSKRVIPLGAMALALMLLSGHGQATLYGALTVGMYALWQAFEDGYKRAPHRLGRLILMALLAAGFAMPGVLPGLERYPYTERANVPPDPGEYEFHLQMWRDFITPLYHGRNVKTFWAPWERVESGYVGVIALCLAIVGLTAVWRRRTIFLWILSLLAVLFALGTQATLYPLLANLPFFNATWKTGRIIYLLSFVLAIAAAQGTAQLLWSRKNFLSGFIFGSVAVIIFLRASHWAGVAPNAEAINRALNGFYLAGGLLATAAGFSVLLGLSRLSSVSLVLILLAELVATGALADCEAMPHLVENPHSEAIAYLHADEGWFRVDVDGAARGLWSPASVMAAGFAVPQGTGNPMEIVAYNQFYWGIPHKGMPAYHLLGVKYIITPKGAQPGGDGVWPVFFQDPLIDMHLNTNALQRVWLVYNTIPVQNLEAAYSYVFSEDFNPIATATLEHGPSLSVKGEGRIEVLAYRPTLVKFYVETSEPALLILSDLRYPGWRAFLDGEGVPIYATDGLFRGVLVPEGSHHIVMRFVPQSLRLGLGLYLTALLVSSGTIVYISKVSRTRNGSKT